MALNKNQLEADDLDNDDHGILNATYEFNNDFVKRNIEITPFYREHERDKRQLFTGIRENNMLQAERIRKQKVLHERERNQRKLQKWDEYRKAISHYQKIRAETWKQRHKVRLWRRFFAVNQIYN